MASGQPNVEHPFGTLGQYRIVADELKAQKPTALEDECYSKLLAFHFELPFQLPWPGNPCSTLLKETFITFRFRPERRNIESHFGYRTTFTVTAVTSVTPAIRFPHLDKNVMSDVFDWTLGYLNELLVAYALVTKDADIGPVTLPMLSPVSQWGYIYPYEDNASVEGLFLINPYSVSYEKPVPPGFITDAVLELKLAMTTQGHPFVTSWQLRIEGEQHFKTGRYDVAAILSDSAFEARCNELLRYLLWKEGRSIDEFDLLLRSKPLVRRVRSEFHTRIGGDFDTRKSGPLGDWYQDCHLLRNRVVHGGYRPSYHDVSRSLAGMIRAWDYIMELVRARSTRFPELAPYLGVLGPNFIWPPPTHA